MTRTQKREKFFVIQHCNLDIANFWLNLGHVRYIAAPPGTGSSSKYPPRPPELVDDDDKATTQTYHSCSLTLSEVEILVQAV